VVNAVGDGSFEVTKRNSNYKILITTNLGRSCIDLRHTERCVGHAKAVSAPSLVVSSGESSLGWYILIRCMV